MTGSGIASDRPSGLETGDECVRRDRGFARGLRRSSATGPAVRLYRRKAVRGDRADLGDNRCGAGAYAFPCIFAPQAVSIAGSRAADAQSLFPSTRMRDRRHGRSGSLRAAKDGMDADRDCCGHGLRPLRTRGWRKFHRQQDVVQLKSEGKPSVCRKAILVRC